MRTIIIIALALLSTVALRAQSNSAIANESVEFFLSGEHYPLIQSGQGTIYGAAHPCTTRWVQVGYSQSAGDFANRNAARFAPSIFTLGLKLTKQGSGDSARVSAARYEAANDTTAAAFWNADSSNKFIVSGAYNLPDYGLWRFEPVADTTRQWLYPLRVMAGGYVRLVLSSDIADTCRVDWALVGQH